jgi:hypothetical protein
MPRTQQQRRDQITLCAWDPSDWQYLLKYNTDARVLVLTSL